MKKIAILFVFALLAPSITHAQGTTYLSNLNQTSIGSQSVGSDSWVASEFFTGNDIGGYALNSIQLGMVDDSGNPSDFTVMIYSASFGSGISPGSELGSLSGSFNPSTAGVYIYTPASSLTLSPHGYYFIVLTAGTPVTSDAYEWSLAIPNSYGPTSGWGGGGVWNSNNGSNWNYNSGALQFAITATPVPEPSAWSLLFLGVGVLFYARTRKQHAA